ncbi:MAG: isochorismatase family protein [Gammaproteobacteria bacterium]|nr:isochorismatase family protein [Gammaproteobacteria bacterium]
MINKFGDNTALLLIDVQQGVDVLTHWGGANGRRNNPDAEQNMLTLLKRWREKNNRIAFTIHDSREAASPLKLSLETGKQKAGFEPAVGDIVVIKDVNSGFIGTSLEIQLRRSGIDRLVVVGFFTNFCVETTVRMAGNLGFDTYLVHDCCATTNRVDLDGNDHDPELVHGISVANMHGEFCTAITVNDALALLDSNVEHLSRAQGNE